ncbi:MAG: hypothetical protein JXR88_08890 [Clostridia bacterium]|nr:hypothetical protein [Clostridia bacterium]
MEDKNKSIPSDCLKELYEIGYLNPTLIKGHLKQFIALLRSYTLIHLAANGSYKILKPELFQLQKTFRPLILPKEQDLYNQF